MKLSSSVCVWLKTLTFTEMGLGAGWVGGCSGGDQGTRVAEMGKHSWGHTALVGLRLNGPLHTFISVFAQGMRPNLHTLISVRGLHRGPTGWDESDPVHSHSLIPPRLNLNVLVFIKAHKGHLWICLCVAESLCGWDGPHNIY